jgi:hypothetical protein
MPNKALVVVAAAVLEARDQPSVKKSGRVREIWGPVLDGSNKCLPPEPIGWGGRWSIEGVALGSLALVRDVEPDLLVWELERAGPVCS